MNHIEKKFKDIKVNELFYEFLDDNTQLMKVAPAPLPHRFLVENPSRSPIVNAVEPGKGPESYTYFADNQVVYLDKEET